MRDHIADRTTRRGFTLAEMLMVIVLFGLVMATFVRVISRQQKFYKGAGDLMQIRGQNRQALSIIPSDLRAISSGGGDIITFSDTAITFRSQIGASILCYKQDATHILLPPMQGLQKGHKLTGWRTRPQAGDEVLIYDENNDTGNSDDLWRVYTIADINDAVYTSANACPSSTGFTTAGDTATSYRVTLTSNLSTTIIQGAPIRFGRRARYRLYRAADLQWYVGYQDSTQAGGWSTTYPISGPHRAYSATADSSGMTLVYRDSAGNVLSTGTSSNRLLVARVDVTVRGQTPGVVDISGFRRVKLNDTLSMSVGVRNRR